MSKPRVMIRGIYATALTQLFLINGFSVTNPSREILERFGDKFNFSPAEVTITDKEDLQGVYVKGEAEKTDIIIELLREVLFDAIVREKIPLNNSWQVGEKIRLYGGFAFYEVEFPFNSKKFLDELRREVSSTIIGHHHLKIIASDKVKEAETILDLYPEKKSELSLKLKSELIYDNYKVGKTIFIEHVKLNGKVLNLSEGKILNFEDNTLTLKRLIKREGVYDGINERKEEGDYVITEAREESWVLKHSYFSKSGELKGELYNINTPIEFYPDKIRYIDLEVDVVNKSFAKIIDEEKLEEALEEGFISEKLAEKALKTAEELIREFKS
ncbi:DUF402 domain-containing protein [Candidatus Bathyarchaeota archaeon]|nr:DUF402 domain-containing protein [Candidatus Bathyarchaeota archaeon]